MTVTEVQTQARTMYNAVGDTFFGDTLINNFIWHACKILAREAWAIERTYSTTTVSGTQEYDFPTNTIAIKRVTWYGTKLSRTTHRQDDAITLSNQTVTTSGAPIYYTTFNFVMSLRPTPNDAQTLKIYSFNDPQAISNTSILEIPTLFHMDLIDYCVSRMFAMDENYPLAKYHMDLWNGHVLAARRWKAKMKRADGFTTVESEDILPVNILGAV